MDWEPVPPGTLPPAALTARGADHDLDFAAGDSIELRIRILPGRGTRRELDKIRAKVYWSRNSTNTIQLS